MQPRPHHCTQHRLSQRPTPPRSWGVRLHRHLPVGSEVRGHGGVKGQKWAVRGRGFGGGQSVGLGSEVGVRNWACGAVGGQRLWFGGLGSRKRHRDHGGVRGRGLGVGIWGWGHSRVRGVMEGSEVGDRVWSPIQNSRGQGSQQGQRSGVRGSQRGQRSRTEARAWGSGYEVRGQRKGS